MVKTNPKTLTASPESAVAVLRAYKEETKTTNQSIADMLSVDGRTVGRWLSNKRKPAPPYIPVLLKLQSQLPSKVSSPAAPSAKVVQASVKEAATKEVSSREALIAEAYITSMRLLEITTLLKNSK